MRDLRLLPIVTVAAGGLLFLKAVGLISGDLSQTGPRPVMAQDTSIPGIESPADRSLVTGSTPAAAQPAAAQPAAAQRPAAANPAAAPTPLPATAQPPTISASERAILERLQERRQELDTRQRELDMRENLLRATERRLEQRANELRELEGRIASLEQRRDEAEQTRFRGVVSMYETMRPKDAARIFDTLDLSVLLEVARAMRPPKLADIIAQMQPDPAKRLTTELARRPNQTASAAPVQISPDALPKIEGRPTR
ncbi:MAG: flagellar protein FlbB [Phreatobacter sp.]|uniref:MotE family protein n=1 Tax=Phreatobacter sp. TaxID=1966341 RepID=UPI001A3BBA2F|nr:flagellar protein FlbB [Phreatobacter sp.]MBL8571090.1 flagellar protein FlbB [Phreatobacter sp.]